MIRAADPADAPAVTALVAAAFGGYVQCLGRNPQPMDDDYGSLIEAGEVFLSECDGDLRGVLVLQVTGDAMLVRTVAVAPGGQGRGIGTALMNYAEQTADRCDLPRILLYTNEVMAGSAKLYQRLGYQGTHRTGPEGRQVIYMVKEVPPDRTPWFDVIVTDTGVCFGKPRIAGTRHYIDFLLSMIEEGRSFDELLAEYPTLERGQLQAMLGFVRDVVASKRNGLKSEHKNG